MKRKLILMLLLVTLSINASQSHMTEQAAQDYTQQLPRELKGLVIGYMSSAEDIETATKNIRSLMHVNKTWNKVLNDQPIVNGLIQDLSERFNVTRSFAAAILRTKAALEWLQQAIRNEKVDISETQLEMDSIIKVGVGAEGDEQKERASIIRFLVKAGAIVDKYAYLQQAVNAADLDLMKLLIALGNKQINTDVNGKVGTSAVLNKTVPLYLITYKKTSEVEQLQAQKYKAIIEFLLSKGAIPGIAAKKTLEEIGFIVPKK